MDYYTFTSDDTVVEGEIEVGKVYDEPDFNRNIEIQEREKKRVEIFMNMIDQREKTLVICATQAHALFVRDTINQITTSKDPNYCDDYVTGLLSCPLASRWRISSLRFLQGWIGPDGFAKTARFKQPPHKISRSHVAGCAVAVGG